MAEAMVRSLIETHTASLGDLLFSGGSEPRREAMASLGVAAAPDTPALLDRANVLIIAVKPQSVAGLLDEIGGGLRRSHLLISICAGIPTSAFEAAAQVRLRVVRAMPNQAVRARCGMTALSCGRHATDADVALATTLFAAGGNVIEVAETAMDAVTAINGSGPAYFYFLVEVLIEAGIREGLPPDVAKTLAVQTAHGAAEVMNVEYHVPPEEHRRRVTSKGGATEAAFRTKEEHRVREGLLAAFHAAAERAGELGGRK